MAATQLGIWDVVNYVNTRAQANNALLGWTDAAGQAWNVTVISVSSQDSSMTTHLRLKFAPIILITLIPDPSRITQEFDIAIAARDTTSGHIAPAQWV